MKYWQSAASNLPEDKAMGLWPDAEALVTKLMVLLLTLAVAVSYAGAEGTVQSGNPRALQWVSDEGEVLWTAKDIVRFDWDRQAFELTREKSMDLMAMEVRLHRGFRVQDSKGLIYRGELVSSMWSGGCDRPTVLMDKYLGSQPMYSISDSYPPGRATGDKTRFAPRLRAALQKAGVLGRIEPSSIKPIEIRTFLGGWTQLEQGIKVWADFFPETLRLEGKARIHVGFLVEGSSTRDFDEIRVEMLLLGDGVHTTLLHELLRIPVSDLREGRRNCICWFDRWRDDSSPQFRAKPGPARILLVISIHKKVGAKWTTCRTYHMQTNAVTVLPVEEP